MNLKLKSEILDKSINIETYLSKILMTLLGIKKLDNRALGYKGTALSFKSKADLLYDIDKISKKLYSNLIMFMEIRNQFIHNFDTDSFQIVLDRVNKKTKILEFYQSGNNQHLKIEDEETKYRLGFINLTISILKGLEKAESDIVSEKNEALKNKIKVLKKTNEIENLDLALKVLADSIDEVTEIFNKRFKQTLSHDWDIGQYLRNGIQGLFEKKMKEEIKKN